MLVPQKKQVKNLIIKTSVSERGHRETAERTTRKAIEKGNIVDIFHALAWQCVADNKDRAVVSPCSQSVISIILSI